MSSRTADVFDLQAYRARRAGQQAEAPAPLASAYALAPFAPLGFAVGFFVVWPTLVFVPQHPSAS